MANAVAETHEAPVAEPALSGPQRLMKFLHDTREEMRRVVTPSREEVRANTIVVIITVFAFAAYFELVDVVIGRSIDKVLLKLAHH